MAIPLTTTFKRSHRIHGHVLLIIHAMWICLEWQSSESSTVVQSPARRRAWRAQRAQLTWGHIPRIWRRPWKWRTVRDRSLSNVYCIHVWLCAILYHTISYYIILYHTISYYIILYHTISYYIYICIIYHNIIIHKYISFGSFFSCSKRSGGRASWQRCCARDHRDSKRSSARCLEHPGSHGMDYIYIWDIMGNI